MSATAGADGANGAPEEEPTPLELFLRKLKERNDLPAFVKNVEAITDVVHDPKARVQFLNNAIQSDVALSAKVLRIANSAIHAAAGRTVETCYQAIMLLGFGRMKDIAVGAAVFEHLNNRSAALKELMATSVITANQSVKLCTPAGVTQVETAYLCGIFRNLGELVVACYKPKEYETFRNAQGADDAERPTDVRAFGFKFDELGRAIAELWGLPKSVTEALNRPPSLTSAPTDRTARLAALTQLSADTTHAIYRTSRSQQTTKLKAAVLQYGNGLGVSEADALEAARAAFAASAGALKAAQSSIDPAMFEERLKAIEETVKVAAAANAGDTTKVAHAAPVPAAPMEAVQGIANGNAVGAPQGIANAAAVTGNDAAGAYMQATASGFVMVGGTTDAPTQTAGWNHGPDATVEPPPPPENKFAKVADTLRGAFSGKRPLSTDEAISRTLAALLSVGFQRSALLLGADNYTRMKTRTAVGEGNEFLNDHLNIVLQPPNGAMAVALLRREDVFADLKTGSPFRADPSVKRLRSASFVLLPVIVAGQPIGALFADAVRAPVLYPDQVRQSLLDIRGALNHAFERLREKAAAVPAGQAARQIGLAS